MFAQVTMLRYWKSEHTSASCEDALGADISRGLFAIADGAGTTLFADAWADFLVQYFLHVPLLSNDPFEVEWWLRQAQDQFKQKTPPAPDLSWNAQQKMTSQGSYTTLTTVRLSACEAEHAEGEVLAVGDSCVFLSRSGNEQVFSFPLTHAEEFMQAPICLPSRSGVFNRYFHRARVAHLDLVPGDCLLIATDAVAKWIVSAGNARYRDLQEALQVLISQCQTPGSWASFIQERRLNQEIVDDDCTALIITFHSKGAKIGDPLGVTTLHSQSVREQRKQAFFQAWQENHKEQVAICFGDGQDLLAEGVHVSQDALFLARQVADAQREVLAMLRQEVNNPNVVAIMTPLWQRYAHLLFAEPCAANLRKTLSRLGVKLEPVEPMEAATSSYAGGVDDENMLLTQTIILPVKQQLLQLDAEEEGKEEHA